VYENFDIIGFYVAFAMIMHAADVNEVIMLGFLWMIDLGKLPHVFFMWRPSSSQKASTPGNIKNW